jgi:hypothetical protein
MTTDPDHGIADAGRLHHIQVRLAFLADRGHPARPGRLISTDGTTVTVAYIDDGTVETIYVVDGHRLDDVLRRHDLCLLDRSPLVLVNTRYRVLGIATGPAAPPPQVEVDIVSRIEDGSVVELISDSDTQPAWQLLAIVET